MAESKTFEQNMARLDEIVRMLEKGDVPLEKSLTLFSEGTAIVKKCGAVLDKAEKKISILTSKQGEAQLEKFDEENAQND